MSKLVPPWQNSGSAHDVDHLRCMTMLKNNNKCCRSTLCAYHVHRGKTKVIVCSLQPCGHLLRRTNLLAILYVMFSCVFVTFPCGVLGQVWNLIVSIPDICRLTYFYNICKIFSILYLIAKKSKKINMLINKRIKDTKLEIHSLQKGEN